MNPTLPSEAVDFGASADKAFAALGGVDAARRAEASPDERRSAVAGVLAALAISELDPRSDLDTAAAAGELCRAAGRVALPYPVVAVLLRDAAGRPFAPVGSAPPAGSGAPAGSGPASGRGSGGPRWRADHGDLFDEWRVATVDGRAWSAAPAGGALGTRLGPFVAGVAPVAELAEPAPADVALHLTLTGWLLLGFVERAVELAVDHVRGRVQFGQPLAGFQAVQFQLADAVTGVDGLRELCRFGLWRIFDDPDGALPDALAVRVHALDAGRSVLRTTQQLHGAAGLCDEYDVSILVRHAQPALRLPFGAERAASELAAAVDRLGFEGLFPHGARA